MLELGRTHFSCCSTGSAPINTCHVSIKHFCRRGIFVLVMYLGEKGTLRMIARSHSCVDCIYSRIKISETKPLEA